MIYVKPDEFYTSIKTKDIYANLGEHIEDEAGAVKKLIEQIEGKNRMPQYDDNQTPLPT